MAVNAWRIQGKLTGVGRYLVSLLREWTSDVVPSGVEIEVHSPKRLTVELPPNLKQVVHSSNARLLLWENTRLGPLVSAGVLFCPSYSRPLLSRSPTVVTLHDATSVIHPEMFPPGQRWLYNPLYGWSARHAHRVIADSEASRADIVRYWHADPDKVVAIPLAPASYFRSDSSPSALNAVRRRFSAEGHPYFVFVGSVSGRRNVPLLIEAFARLRPELPDFRLVLVTLNPHSVDLTSVIQRLSLEKHVVFTGYVPHEELCPIYAAAHALVIPSIYETTSLPALEAQASGTPVVCIDTTGMREVTGSCSSRFVRLDPDFLAQAMLRVAMDPAYRERLSRDGIHNAAQFNWKRSARQTLEVLLDAAR